MVTPHQELDSLRTSSFSDLKVRHEGFEEAAFLFYFVFYSEEENLLFLLFVIQKYHTEKHECKNKNGHLFSQFPQITWL